MVEKRARCIMCVVVVMGIGLTWGSKLKKKFRKKKQF